MANSRPSSLVPRCECITTLPVTVSVSLKALTLWHCCTTHHQVAAMELLVVCFTKVGRSLPFRAPCYRGPLAGNELGQSGPLDPANRHDPRTKVRRSNAGR